MLRRRHATGSDHRLLLVPLGFGAALAAAIVFGGCGKPKADQCRALVGAIVKAERASVADDGSTSREARKKYFDDLLAAKNELAAFDVGDSKLVELRDREAKNLEDYMFAMRAMDKARVPSELSEAEGRVDRILKSRATDHADLAAYCGMELPAPPPPAVSGTSTAASAPPSAASDPSAATSATASAASAEAWLPFHHPTLPFEAQYFQPPEVGQRKAPNSITDAAIATDDRRMFSAAYVSFPAPPVRDCKTLLEAFVKQTEEHFHCSRSGESSAPVNDLPTLEVKLACGDGGTMLKRVSCIAKPSEKSVVLFDVEAIYLRDWNPIEARKFADSAKVSAR